MITVNLLTTDTNLVGRLIQEYGTEAIRTARRWARGMGDTYVPVKISVR